MHVDYPENFLLRVVHISVSCMDKNRERVFFLLGGGGGGGGGGEEVDGPYHNSKEP